MTTSGNVSFSSLKSQQTFGRGDPSKTQSKTARAPSGARTSENTFKNSGA